MSSENLKATYDKGEKGKVTENYVEKADIYQTKRLMKCRRQGDNVCYSHLQDLVVRTIKPESDNKPYYTRDQNAATEDSIHSGESVYKNLSFERVQNEIETRKCLAFWKNVMDRNIQPIRSTLLKLKDEGKDIMSSSPDSASTSKQPEPAQKPPPPPPEPPKCKKTPSEQEDMFRRIFEEVKKKNLDQMKLVVKQNCKTCELTESIDAGKVLSCDEKNKNSLDELKEEMDATSKRQPQKFHAMKTDKQMKKKVSGEQLKKSSSSKIVDSDRETPDKQTTVSSKAKPKKKQSGRTEKCSCKVDPCECKHDLAQILQDLGKGPCVCGMAKCTCRENFHLEHAALSKTKSIPQKQSIEKNETQKTNENVPLKSIISNSEMKSRTSNISIKSEKCRCYETEDKDNQKCKHTSETSICLCPCHRPMTNKTKEPVIGKNSSSELIKSQGSSNSNPKEGSRRKSSISIQEVIRPNRADKVDSNVRNIGDASTSKSKNDQNKKPATNTTSIKQNIEKRDSFQTKFAPEPNISHTGRKLSCASDYGSAISNSLSQANTSNIDSNPDSDSKTNTKQTSKSEKKARKKCICGCGHVSCKCEDSKSISKVVEQIEGQMKSKTSKSSFISLTAKEESKTTKLSKSKQQRTDVLNVGEPKTSQHSNCSCKFPDCDCGTHKEKSDTPKGKSCKCSFPDCDCAGTNEAHKKPSLEESRHKLKVLMSLKERFQKAEDDYNQNTPEDKKFSSTGIQCSHIVPAKVEEHRYCYICGHTDCPCRMTRAAS